MVTRDTPVIYVMLKQFNISLFIMALTNIGRLLVLQDLFIISIYLLKDRLSKINAANRNSPIAK